MQNRVFTNSIWPQKMPKNHEKMTQKMQIIGGGLGVESAFPESAALT